MKQNTSFLSSAPPFRFFLISSPYLLILISYPGANAARIFPSGEALPLVAFLISFFPVFFRGRLTFFCLGLTFGRNVLLFFLPCRSPSDSPPGTRELIMGIRLSFDDFFLPKVFFLNHGPPFFPQ